MQGIFIKTKLGQSKSKLVTDLVDSCGPLVRGFQSLPPVDVCDVHETCCVFFLLDISVIFFSLLPGNSVWRDWMEEAAVTRPASAGLVTRPVIGWRGCEAASDWRRDHHFSESEATGLQIYTYNANNTTSPSYHQELAFLERDACYVFLNA